MSHSPPFVYLSRNDLEALAVSTAESVAAIESMIEGQVCGRVWTTPKSAFTTPDGRYMMSTLAASDDPPLLVVKSLVLDPGEPERRRPGIPAINSTVTVLDSRTGLPVAIIDGNWITAIRTAGLSAVAAKRLARADASVVAFIGCGVQANSHLTAFSEIFSLAEVRVFGRGRGNRDALCARAEWMGYRAVASRSGQEAVEGADLVVTSVTLSPDTTPFLDARGLRPGAFAAVTDFARPWHAEHLSCFDRIVVDDLEQETASATPMVDPGLVRGDLKGLVAGEVPPRASDEERSAFIFRGHAIGDLALAAVVCRKAREAGAGTPIRSQDSPDSAVPESSR